MPHRALPHLLAATLALAAGPAGALSCDVLFDVGSGFTIIRGVAKAERDMTVHYRMTAEVRSNGNRSLSQQGGEIQIRGDQATSLSRIMVNNKEGAMAAVRITVTGGQTSAGCSAEHMLSDAPPDDREY